MIASKQELFSVLMQFNPWWSRAGIPDLPNWKRAAFFELKKWVCEPPAKRAVLLSGARQVGKTTLLLQIVQDLISSGVRPEQILYVTFDHPLLKLEGLEATLKIWREIQPRSEKVEYLLLDEIQHTKDWQVWLKHQVDFEKNRRIAVSGSALPLGIDNVESGVGRWHTIKLPTLSFFEYLQIKNISIPDIPSVSSLTEIFNWSQAKMIKVGESARPLISHFHEYLLRGGFPQTALVDSITIAQKLTREDIIDKVLKRDMTALFGVRRVLELEKVFLYLCLHDGGLLDIAKLCENLELKKPTVSKFIDLLEAAHLIYKLPPYGLGKEVLRARYKVYLADPAMPGSVLLKGKALLEDETRLGVAVETAVFKHLFNRYYQIDPQLTYWRGKKSLEVDILAELQGKIIPFEVKYNKSRVEASDLKGMNELCQSKSISRGYVMTREVEDFGVMNMNNLDILKVPAFLACYWLSQSEKYFEK